MNKIERAAERIKEYHDGPEHNDRLRESNYGRPIYIFKECELFAISRAALAERAERERALREALEASNKMLKVFAEHSDDLPKTAVIRLMKDNRALLETDHE